MKDTGVDEGSLVYALGFPMNLVDNSVKAPICRLGCISRVEDTFENPQKATKFLVDAQTFPGNSGGPIVSRPEHISIDGTPYTVLVFFRTDTKETGMGKIMQLVKRDIAANPIAE